MCAIGAKVERSEQNLQWCQSGVLISDWFDVAHSLQGASIHSLDANSIERGSDEENLSIRSLRNIAVCGPYDIATYNCHHQRRNFLMRTTIADS